MHCNNKAQARLQGPCAAGRRIARVQQEAKADRIVERNREAGAPAMARPVAGVAPGPGVAPGRGVAPAASGCGVAATAGRGVMPLKSESNSSGFSPPNSGVCPACSREHDP